MPLQGVLLIAIIPRAAPWVITDTNLSPCKGKSFTIMAQSLSKIYIHLIFHIKTTSPKIRENDLERLHNYIGKLVKTTGCVEIKAGGVGDHVHVLFIYKAFALSGRIG